MTAATLGVAVLVGAGIAVKDRIVESRWIRKLSTGSLEERWTAVLKLREMGFLKADSDTGAAGRSVQGDQSIGFWEEIMILGALAEVYEKVPVKIPNGTEGGVAAALRELHRCPDSGFESSRPGWSSVRYNEAMEDLKRFGQAAAPALLANIDNYRIQLAVIQVLGDLRVEEAVPELVERLWMEDCFHDSLIVAKLANITGHPEGYGFHRRWFDEAVRVKAVATYKQWWNVKALAKIQGESTGSARAP